MPSLDRRSLSRADMWRAKRRQLHSANRRGDCRVDQLRGGSAPAAEVDLATRDLGHTTVVEAWDARWGNAQGWLDPDPLVLASRSTTRSPMRPPPRGPHHRRDGGRDPHTPAGCAGAGDRRGSVRVKAQLGVPMRRREYAHQPPANGLDLVRRRMTAETEADGAHADLGRHIHRLQYRR